MKKERKTAYYIHGATPEEQVRLSKLNIILNDNCLREMNLRGGERILDVGAGLGQYTRALARRVADGGAVVGIERDPAQLMTAKRLAREDGESDLVDFRLGDALEFPLTGEEWGTFDLVHTRFVLEHLPHPEEVVAQMARAARPGGRIILADDDHATFTPYPAPPGFTDIWQAYLRSYDRMGNDPYVGRRLHSLLHAAGATGIRNTLVFFGGCAGQEVFPYAAENLIGILMGARELMLRENLLDEYTFDRAIENLYAWKELPDAALWYGICWAEGRMENGELKMENGGMEN